MSDENNQDTPTAAPADAELNDLVSAVRLARDALYAALREEDQGYIAQDAIAALAAALMTTRVQRELLLAYRRTVAVLEAAAPLTEDQKTAITAARAWLADSGPWPGHHEVARVLVELARDRA